MDVDNDPRQSQAPFYSRGVPLHLQKGRLSHGMENNGDTAGQAEQETEEQADSYSPA